MKTIHKYQLPLKEKVVIKMPKGAIALHVENQDGFPCLWAVVDTDNPMADHHFRLFKTGQDASSITDLGHFSLIGRVDIDAGGQLLGLWVFRIGDLEKEPNEDQDKMRREFVDAMRKAGAVNRSDGDEDEGCCDMPIII